MKILLSSRRLFILGFVIIVTTNIIVLSGVAYNRLGEPATLITLTNRELRLTYRIHNRYEENGRCLHFDVRGLHRHDWLNTEKLKELGFNIVDCSRENNAIFCRKPTFKEVFIVFEYNGQAYREVVKEAERNLEKEEGLLNLNPENEYRKDQLEIAKYRLEYARIMSSRLFAIDAGLNFKTLKEKYKDQAHFIIMKGLVKHHGKCFGDKIRLSLENIHVPLNHRKVFDTILAQSKSRRMVPVTSSSYKRSLVGSPIFPPIYEIELAYGRRQEPWIVSVRPLDDDTCSQ